MKRTITLFMLFIFLLNVLGFYGLFMGLKFSNSIQAMHDMDQDRYSLDRAITFKVPLTVPYYTGTEGEYQRVDGEFESNGYAYRMVKQKLANDTLYVVCVNDQKTKDINDAMSDYVKTFSDKPASTKHQTTKSLSLIKDYFSTSVAMSYGVEGWFKKIDFVPYRNYFQQQSQQKIFSPPKILSIV